MTTTSRLRWSLALAALCVLSAAVAAQPAPVQGQRRYVEFKIDADYEAELKKRLALEKQIGPLKDLIDQILADPSKLPAGMDKLKGLKMEDENFRNALKELLARDPALQNALRDLTLNKNAVPPPDDVKRFQDKLKDVLGKTPTPLPPEDLKLPVGAAPIEPEPDKIDFAKATEQAMKRAETTGLGTWLRESKAWNRALADLRTSFNDADSSRWQLNDLQKRLLEPEGTLWKLGAGTIDHIRDMPRPSLPGIEGLALPSVGGPALPDLGGETMPALGTIATWLLFLGVLAAIGWQLLRWTRSRTRRHSEVRALLGPWPVQPDAVATRTELILAFEYLALLTLGLAVKSWNHHAIARRWGAEAEACTNSAATLAALYELARYTEGADALNDVQREDARRALAKLAEAL